MIGLVFMWIVIELILFLLFLCVICWYGNRFVFICGNKFFIYVEID